MLPFPSPRLNHRRKAPLGFQVGVNAFWRILVWLRAAALTCVNSFQRLDLALIVEFGNCVSHVGVSDEMRDSGGITFLNDVRLRRAAQAERVEHVIMVRASVIGVCLVTCAYRLDVTVNRYFTARVFHLRLNPERIAFLRSLK